MIQTNIKPTEIMFLDIETVRGAESLFKMSKDQVLAWKGAVKNNDEGLGEMQLFTRDAALYPEFGKIVCISVGYFENADNFKVKAYCNDDEKALLQEITQVIPKITATRKYFCGHYIKGFDFPYIIRRSVVHGVHLPTSFNIYGLKPWELTHLIDTMEIWKIGAFGLGCVSLQAICAALGIENPKEEMSGDMVSTIYYNRSDPDRLKKIGEYCNSDVVAVAKVFSRFSKTEVNFKVTNIL